MDRRRKDVTKTPRRHYWKDVGLNIVTGTLVVCFFLLVFSGTAEAYYSSTKVIDMTGTELFRLIVAALRTA